MRRGKKTHRMPFRERLSEMCDVPLAALGGASTVEVTDGQEAVVTGCRSVRAYSPQEIVLRTERGEVRICGDGLCIRSLLGDRITVYGRIRTVHTEEDTL